MHRAMKPNRIGCRAGCPSHQAWQPFIGFFNIGQGKNLGGCQGAGVIQTTHPHLRSVVFSPHSMTDRDLPKCFGADRPMAALDSATKMQDTWLPSRDCLSHCVVCPCRKVRNRDQANWRLVCKWFGTRREGLEIGLRHWRISSAPGFGLGARLPSSLSEHAPGASHT